MGSEMCIRDRYIFIMLKSKKSPVASSCSVEKQTLREKASSHSVKTLVKEKEEL